MAAGLGFKTFVSGEVLTAADTNGYLMQGILVFASSSARSAAVTSPQEGQYSYLKDTNVLEYYDGAAWVGQPIGDITAVTAGSGIAVTNGTGPIPTVALDLTSANTYSAAQTATRYIVTGSTVATNGIYLPAANSLGLSTNSVERIRIDSSGNVGIGITPSAGTSFASAKNVTGSAIGIAVSSTGQIQSDVTTAYRGYLSTPTTAAAAFNPGSISHFYAAMGTIGAGSTISNQYAFNASASVTGASNNYGFFGNIAAAANSYNFYAQGTAVNYFAGRTGVGILLTTSAQFGVTNVQSATDVTFISRNFAAQTAESWAIQNSAGSNVFAVTAAGLMQYISSNTAATVGAAGGASALPATPTGYLKIDIAGTNYKVPYYAN